MRWNSAIRAGGISKLRSPCVIDSRLTDVEREAQFELTDEQRAELDRRWAQHVADPSSAVPWPDVRAKVLG